MDGMRRARRVRRRAEVVEHPVEPTDDPDNDVPPREPLFEPPLWVTEYDYANRRVTRTIAAPGWTGICLDEWLSDPDGDFDVYVAHNPHRDEGLSSSEAAEPGEVVKIVARLDGDGDVKVPHPDFDTGSIGSPTIWPYAIAGERFGLAHWVLASREQPFPGPVRTWEEAHRIRAWAIGLGPGYGDSDWEDSDVVPLMIVHAAGLDSPIVRVSRDPDSDLRGGTGPEAMFSMICERVADRGMTPHEVVGSFGIRGTYREIEPLFDPVSDPVSD